MIHTGINLASLLWSQAAQQLRFVRQWSVFGKTLQKSTKELAAAGLAFALLVLAYTQLGFLVNVYFYYTVKTHPKLGVAEGEET